MKKFQQLLEDFKQNPYKVVVQLLVVFVISCFLILILLPVLLLSIATVITIALVVWILCAWILKSLKIRLGLIKENDLSCNKESDMGSS